MARFRLGIATGLTLGLLSLATSAGAQTAQQAGVGGGISFSEFNATSFSTSSNERLNVDFTTKLEPSFGGFFAFRLGGLVTLEVDALFTIKGSEYTSGVRTDRFRLTYLEAPVLVRIGQWTGRAAHVNVVGGVYFARLLDASQTTNGARINIHEDLFEPWDFGWVAGVGVTMSGMQLDGRYSGGFTGLVQQGFQPVLPAQGRKFTNRGFTVLAAVYF